MILKVDWNEHSFSNYLKINEWKGSVKHISRGRICVSEFINPQGESLARVLYNNEKSTHVIFIPYSPQGV